MLWYSLEAPRCNVCFRGEIRRLLWGWFLFSGAMGQINFIVHYVDSAEVIYHNNPKNLDS